MLAGRANCRVEHLKAASLFTNKHWTRLERLAMDKHSRFLQKIVNYDPKKFYNIGAWKVVPG
jgi:hypothetical protein